jgi:hypothetical protein
VQRFRCLAGRLPKWPLLTFQISNVTPVTDASQRPGMPCEKSVEALLLQPLRQLTERNYLAILDITSGERHLLIREAILMNESEIWAVSIHDMHPNHFLSVDLKDILGCLHDIADFVWVAKDFESTSDVFECRMPYTTSELLAALERSGQTINGTILGTPQESVMGSNLETVSDILQFRTSPAQVAILAVDSSYFDVLTKNQAHIEQLTRRFADIRLEDPAEYC